MNGLHIYKASAGSGKTTALAVEYIKLLFQEERGWRAALAVTFTNKAAAEIKTRILEYLHALAHTPPKRLRGALREAFDALCREVSPDNPAAAEAEIPERAARILNGLLHDYGAFGVSTIDAFFQRMLRAFTRELDITFDFEVEMDAAAMLDAALRRFFRQVGHSERLTNWMLAFLQEKMEESARPGWRIQAQISALGAELFSDRFMSLPRAAVGSETQFGRMEAYRDQLNAQKKVFETKIRQTAQEGLNMIEAAGLSISDFNRGNNGFMSGYGKLAGGNFDPPTATLERAFSDILSGRSVRWWANNAPKRSEIAACLEAGLNDNFYELARLEADYGRWLRTLSVMRETLYTQGLMADLRNELNQYLAERDLFMISDTNYRLQEISGGGDALFIYEKLGSRYRRYLIDEFQDTSRAQWENLAPLLENALAEGERALIVGDVKQAIYRWRGGDFRLLLREVRERFHASFPGMVAEQALNTNYRSLPAVVRFNNTAFLAMRELTRELRPAPGAAEDLDLMYRPEDLVQFPFNSEPEGYVDVRFFEGAKDVSTPLQLERVLEIIDEKRADGYDWRDIVILTRTRVAGALVAEFLREKGITEVISESSLKLKYAPAAQVLVSAMRLLHAPDDELALANLLYYRALCDDRAKDGAPPFDWREWTKKRNEPNLLALWTPAAFSERTAFLHKLSLPEMTEELIRCFGLQETSEGWLARFLDLTLEYTAKHGAGLEGFLRWFAEKGGEQSVVVSPDADAVRIMTIHKSKGLEFPVVILPFANWKLKPEGRSWIWAPLNDEITGRLGLDAPPAYAPVKDKKSLADTYFADDYFREWREIYADGLNMFYVAATRAARELHILAPKPKKSKTSNPTDSINNLLKNALERRYDFASASPVLAELTYPASLKYLRRDGFAYGEPAPPAPRERAKDAPIPLRLEAFVSRSWRERIVMQKETELAQLMRPGARRESAKAAAAKDWGTLTHEVLAELPLSDSPAEELSFVLERFVMRGRVDSEEALRLQTEAGALLALPEAAEWFAPAEGKVLKQENSVLLKEGLTYRPDLVILEGGGATVVDWKTGQPRPEHTEQLRAYGESMRAMGYATVKLRLAYISETPEIVGAE